jgi:hypothetical protein
MPVGDEKKAVVLILQLHPVVQGPMQMAQMKFSGGPHSAQHPLFRHNHVLPQGSSARSDEGAIPRPRAVAASFINALQSLICHTAHEVNGHSMYQIKRGLSITMSGAAL